MRGNSHVRYGVGEKMEITSKSYLSLKSGWGALAGGFAIAKGLESGINMIGRTAKGGANLAKGIGGVGKGLGSGALQTAAGVGGLGKGLATQGNKEKQPALHEEMKKAGMAGEKGNAASKGQNSGNEQKAQQQGLSSTEKQEGGKNTEGNASEGKGASQGSSLQDEMVRPYGCVWDCCRSKQLMWS